MVPAISMKPIRRLITNLLWIHNPSASASPRSTAIHDFTDFSAVWYGRLSDFEERQPHDLRPCDREGLSAMTALSAMAVIPGVASRMPDDAVDDRMAPAPS